MGGHVGAGESYQQAFERELQEELNLDASKITYQVAGKLTPSIHKVCAHMHLYLINTNVAPDYNPDDFVGAQWRDIPELLAALKKGEPAKGDLLPLVKFVQGML